jgi:phage protein D
VSPQYVTRPSITVDGMPLDPALVPLTEVVEVDDHLHLPDRFAITFADRDGSLLDRSHIRIGSALRISGQAMDEQSETTLFDGEVTALEGAFGTHGAQVIVRGYDQSHRLLGVGRTETYQDVTDSDIARTIAGRAGLQVGTVDESSLTHKHISQFGVSDWDFLWARANEIGFDVRVVDGKLEFRKRASADEAPPEGDLSMRQARQLVWGANLQEFYPRITSAEQVSQVEVRGWDPASKEGLVGTAAATTRSATLPDTPASLSGTTGRERFVSGGRALSEQSAVDEAAAAEAERIASSHAEAEGVAFGNTALKAGVAVSISGVGRVFSGRYVLTQTRHIFDGSGYRTTFQVTGRHDRSLLGLTGGAAANGSSSAGSAGAAHLMNGLIIAIVTDNVDPDDLGRVRLKFPSFDAGYESFWARVALPGAGPDSGLVFLPEVNDEVLVGFESGDIRRPYVIGGLWNGQDRPPLGNDLFANGGVRRRGIVSRRSHKFVFFDDANQSGIALISGDGKIRVSLNQTDGTLVLHSDDKITIRSTGEMKLDAGSNLKIQAGGNLELEGSGNVKLKGGGIVDIDGSLIQLN